MNDDLAKFVGALCAGAVSVPFIFLLMVNPYNRDGFFALAGIVVMYGVFRLTYYAALGIQAEEKRVES